MVLAVTKRPVTKNLGGIALNVVVLCRWPPTKISAFIRGYLAIT